MSCHLNSKVPQNLKASAKTSGDSLLSTIRETLVLIDSTQQEVLIPTLLQDNYQEYDVRTILNTANLIKAVIIGKRVSSIEIKDENYNTTNTFTVDGDNIGSHFSDIINEICSLKKSLNQFKALLSDLKDKYEESVQSLIEKKD